MKKIILYIDTMYRGGAQRVMANLASYFSENQDVILVNDFEMGDERETYNLPSNVRRMFLRKKLGGNPIIKNISRVVELRKIIRSEKPDAVLSFLGNPNKRMLLASIGLKCRKVVSVRNVPEYEYGNGIINKCIVRLLFFLADGVVFQTREAADFFQEAVQKKSEIIYNPVSDKFYNVERKELTSNIVTVGRFERQKNHKLLIKAWAKIQKEFPEDRLIIFGEGEMRQEYETLIQKLNIQGRVELPGLVTDVEEKLASAKVFVLSSDFEGMPNALMEAMAVGVPPISTDCPCGGPRALICEKKEGMIVPCNDVEAMAKAIRDMLKSDSRMSISMAVKRKAMGFHEREIFKKWEQFVLRGER